MCIVAAHAAPLKCEDWNEDTPNKLALARVVTTQARLHFIGPNKRRQKAFLVSGDEVLVNMITRGFLPRVSLQVVLPEPASARQWEGKWRRDSEADIVVKQSDGDEVQISGIATWGGSDARRVKRGAINTGELSGTGKPRGQVLAIGYDPERSAFPPSERETDLCAAQLELHGRYLLVEDNGKCGGVNVSFTGLYVRVDK
jgi:hypothetical protein